jgi:ATP-binding cassette, subfamily B, bacterial MsbA
MHSSFWRTIRRVFSYVRPYRAIFAGGIAGALLYAAVSSSLGELTRRFLDGTFLQMNPRMLAVAPACLVGIFLLRALGDFTESCCMGYVGRRIVEAIRNHVFGHMLELPMSAYDRSDSATLLSRLTYQSELVAQTVTDSMVSVVRECLTVLAIFAYLFYLNALLTVLALVTVPLIFWLMHAAQRPLRRFSHEVQGSIAGLTMAAKEALDAPRTVRAYNAKSYRKELFSAANAVNRRANMRLVRAKAALSPLVQLLASFAVAGVLYVAIRQALAGTLTAAAFTAFIVSLFSVSQPIRTLSSLGGPLQQGIAAADELFCLLDTPPEPRGGTAVPRARGDIAFVDVSFRYEGSAADALSSISLRVLAGQTVALVGTSGSGKTTIASLIPRFYDPTTGVIKLDGKSLRDLDLYTLRSQISFVTQDIVLFNDSIRNNIRLGWSATDAEVERAAERAHLLEFVKNLPHGLDAPVGDRGVLLSGGQKQRISIARALLRNAPILILDEATSALDAHSEAVVAASLEQLKRDRTTFVVAHRIATVERADLIVVLRDGRIVESGSHQELMRAAGEYESLHRAHFNV